MNRVATTLIVLLITSCSSYNYSPERDRLILENGCGHIEGQFSVDSSRMGAYTNLGFWGVSQYERVSIDRDNETIRFLAVGKDGSTESLILPPGEQACANGVLEIDIDNQFQNNGGVSVYEARKIELFSYSPDVVYMRFIQKSTGLVFMVPASVAEDSVVTLRRVPRNTKQVADHAP